MIKRCFMLICILICGISMISCAESYPKLPITTDRENSYVIHVDGVPIEAYELPRIYDNGEDWGDPSGGIPYQTAKDLRQEIEKRRGVILRVKVNQLYQDDYYIQTEAYETYCNVELTVECVYENFSDKEIAVGDVLNTIQYDAVVKLNGEEYLYAYEGSANMRPGFSYILFATVKDEGQLRICQYGTLWQIGVFELASKESRDSFVIYKRGDRGVAEEVYATYAPEILK